jgi:methyl-accepting chemotaxis protein
MMNSIIDKFDNLRIAKKLSVSMTAVIMLFVLSSVFTVFQLVRIGGELEEIADFDIVLTEKFTQATIHQLEQAINFEKALRYIEVFDTVPDARENYKHTTEQFFELGHKVDEEMAWMATFISEEMGHTSLETTRKKFNGILLTIKKIQGEHNDYTQSVNRILDAVNQGDMKKVHTLSIGKIKRHFS